MKKAEKIHWICNIRVLATVMVITIHVCCYVAVNFPQQLTSYWWVLNVFDSCARACVPLFVMLTGTLFLSHEIELKPFLQKRMVRIIVPFLFWLLIYVLYRIFSPSVETFHFWYIYMIVGLYLFLPVINKWLRNSTEKEILYFLFIWLITIILSYNFIEKRIDSNFKPVYFSGYIGYLVLGYYLANVNKKFKNIIYLLLILFAFAVTIFGNWFSATKLINVSFSSYLAVNTALAAIGIFLFVKNYAIKNKALLKIIQFIDRYSFGIYLVHLLVLDILWTVSFNIFLIFPIISIPVITFLTLSISVLIVFTVNKLPKVGKYISG